MPMTAPRGPRADRQKAAGRMRKADRKRQLLDHAKELFIKHGYQNTTTKMIVEAAGVSEPVLYQHFGTKQELFLEVLRQIREATLNRWRTETMPLTDPLAKLHAIADMYLGTSREQAREFHIMHRTLLECDGDEEITAQLRSFYLDNEEILAKIIAEGQQTGVFRRTLDPRIGAWELIRAALGHTLTLPLGIPLYREPDYIPRAIESLLNCLLKTDV
jgi:AcrR family transcriptional regulator